MNVRGVLSLLGLVILWGSAFPVIKIGLDGLSVPHLTLVRHIVASLCFIPFLVLFRLRLLPRMRDIPWFMALGTVGIGLYHLSLNAGELRVSAGATSLIIAAAPAISALLARFFLSDRLPVMGWVGSGVSFAGVALIVGGESSTLGIDAYALLVLLAAFCAAVFFVWQKSFLTRYRSTEVTAFATWGATIPLLAFLPGLATDASGSGSALLAAAYLGVFPSAIAYSLLAYALSQAVVSLVSAYLYLVPVFALLFSWFLLGEIPQPLTLVGGAVTVAGIVVVNRVKRKEALRAGLRTERTGPVGGRAVALHRPRR